MCLTNVKAPAPAAAHCLSQEPFFLPESKMSTALTESSPLSDITAIAMGLTALCIGTVGLIGGTGLLMWVFGL